jgi:two-component system, OmpR family, response regulator MtrA
MMAPVPIALYWLTDPMERDLVKLVLQRAGYHAIGCQETEEVQAHIQVDHPSLLVMDIVLPGINGLELAKLIKEKFSASVPFILVVTSLAFPDIIAQARQAGADDFVVKPIDGNMLFERVNRLIKRSLSVNPAGT